VLAAPIRSGEKVIGLLEFLRTTNAFGENTARCCSVCAETIVQLSTAARVQDLSAPPPAAPKPFTPSPGSILFAHGPRTKCGEKSLSSDEDRIGGIRLPRAHLYLLICAAATIFLALGFILAPWIQEKLHAGPKWGTHGARFSQPLPPTTVIPAVETASLGELQQLAEKADPAAENALGSSLRFRRRSQADDSEAARWFTKAARTGT